MSSVLLNFDQPLAGCHYAAVALLTMYSVRAMLTHRSAVSYLACAAPVLILLEQHLILLMLSIVCCGLVLFKATSGASCFDLLHDTIWTVQVARRLPLNALSRLWGRCHQLPLPAWMRSPAYRLYSHVCKCNLEEAEFKDLRQFRNLSEFFRRDLKPHVRPVCSASGVVSPADGTILHFGRVTCGHLEQVKGITYTLQGFLGPRPLGRGSLNVGRSSTSPNLAAPMETRVQDAVYHEQLKVNPENELYHCVIYLSPGDYHKFHSAADWQVDKRRHFPGFLLSVSPRVANLIRGLFCLNERAVYLGRWRHGFFSYTAVGATNVGSIRVFKDDMLKTNQKKPGDVGKFEDRQLGGISVSKGELFGEFNLGSTIVLLFEAPKSFQFNLTAGQKIRVGESLCHL